MARYVVCMRPRKIHVQGDLFAPKRRKRRRGVKLGRPPRGPRSSERHKRRLDFRPTQPIHVTCRVEEAVETMRRRDAYHAVRKAMLLTLGSAEFRIVHISLERDHVHLLVEANDKYALARGMQVFQSAAARLLNKAISKARRRLRRGRVFQDRYHPVVITNPTQAHHSLSYVLNNWRRHKRDEGGETMFWDVDFFSSGPMFDGWKELDGTRYPLPDGYVPLPVAMPHTWLLAQGWKRAGTISMHGRPGPRAR